MIGGYDTIYKDDDVHSLLEQIIGFLGWEVYEWDGNDLFLYESELAKQTWDNMVAPENTMVHFIVNPGQLTVVTDQDLTDSIRIRFPHFSHPRS